MKKRNEDVLKKKKKECCLGLEFTQFKQNDANQKTRGKKMSAIEWSDIESVPFANHGSWLLFSSLASCFTKKLKSVILITIKSWGSKATANFFFFSWVFFLFVTLFPRITQLFLTHLLPSTFVRLLCAKCNLVTQTKRSWAGKAPGSHASASASAA